MFLTTLKFCSLRAYPRQQLHKICCALKANDLPWDSEEVINLVYMALFQLGEIDYVGPSPSLTWRTDSPMASLEENLKKRISDIRVSPRNRKSLFVLSLLVKYLAVRNEELGFPLVKAYIDACLNLAKIHEPLNGSSPKEAVANRAVQALCLMHAISVFAHSDLVSHFLPEFFRLNIGVRQLLVYEQDAILVQKEWTTLRKTYHKVIARSALSAVDAVDTNLASFLPNL